jgi:hypothetical protein
MTRVIEVDRTLRTTPPAAATFGIPRHHRPLPNIRRSRTGIRVKRVPSGDALMAHALLRLMRPKVHEVQMVLARLMARRRV